MMTEFAGKRSMWRSKLNARPEAEEDGGMGGQSGAVVHEQRPVGSRAPLANGGHHRTGFRRVTNRRLSKSRAIRGGWVG
eukprot:scaffold37577_cov13-Tisochrysis_lutea.AAC.1